jgi:Mg-chelatase subunit ChlD
VLVVAIAIGAGLWPVRAAYAPSYLLPPGSGTPASPAVITSETMEFEEDYLVQSESSLAERERAYLALPAQAPPPQPISGKKPEVLRALRPLGTHPGALAQLGSTSDGRLQSPDSDPATVSEDLPVDLSNVADVMDELVKSDTDRSRRDGAFSGRTAPTDDLVVRRSKESAKKLADWRGGQTWQLESQRESESTTMAFPGPEIEIPQESLANKGREENMPSPAKPQFPPSPQQGVLNWVDGPAWGDGDGQEFKRKLGGKVQLQRVQETDGKDGDDTVQLVIGPLLDESSAYWWRSNTAEDLTRNLTAEGFFPDERGALGTATLETLVPVLPVVGAVPEAAYANPIVVPAGQRTYAQQALFFVRSAGLHLRPQGQRLQYEAAGARLSPTATYGLEREQFKAAFGTEPMLPTAEDPLATFAFDDDTASYDRARMALAQGQQPDGSGIRSEHFVNAMPKEYPAASGPDAFTVYAEAAPQRFVSGPSAEGTVVLSLGAIAREAAAGARKGLNLTLCIDASGSMGRPGGLDRIVAGVDALLSHLDGRDRVALVVFDDRARLVLPATAGDRHDALRSALASLRGSGSTNAAEGLALAYQVAAEMADDAMANRVIFCTDGATLAGDSADAVVERIRAYGPHGIVLSVIGCGAQDYAADALERLADAGDGEHRFVGSVADARQLFTTRLLPARLQTLARDAKIQVSWNPDRVSHHRVIGFEERRLSREQFRDDRVDAGELSQGSQASALFEIVLREDGAGPLGQVSIRYFDTRRDRVVEQRVSLGGGIVRARMTPRLNAVHLLK